MALHKIECPCFCSGFRLAQGEGFVCPMLYTIRPEPTVRPRSSASTQSANAAVLPFRVTLPATSTNDPDAGRTCTCPNRTKRNTEGHSTLSLELRDSDQLLPEDGQGSFENWIMQYQVLLRGCVLP